MGLSKSYLAFLPAIGPWSLASFCPAVPLPTQCCDAIDASLTPADFAHRVHEIRESRDGRFCFMSDVESKFEDSDFVLKTVCWRLFDLDQRPRLFPRRKREAKSRAGPLCCQECAAREDDAMQKASARSEVIMLAACRSEL